MKTSTELELILNKIGCSFKICAADELPELTERPIFLIVNTDPGHLPGKHWVVIYLPENKVPVFFDSAGMKPQFYHKHFRLYLIRHGPKYMYNASRIQDYESTTCGLYCIYYINETYKGRSLHEVLGDFDVNNYSKNENVVVKYVLDR